MNQVLRNALALLAIIVLWFVIQTVLNALFYFIGSMRGDGTWWFFFMKNILSPGVAAYASFAAVASYMGGISWRVLLIAFLVALFSYTAWSVMSGAEYYLSAQRVDDWRDFLWSASISAVASAIGAAIIAAPAFRTHTE